LNLKEAVRLSYSLRWPWVSAGILIALLIALIVYSVAFKAWCTQYERAWGGTWGEKAFSAERGACIRQKSLFEF
jgi:hypothetical protein